MGIRAFDRYKPLTNLGKQVKECDGMVIKLENGLEIHLWDIIQLEIEAHMDKYSEKVALQKQRKASLKKSSEWEAKHIIKHDQQGINIGNGKLN